MALPARSILIVALLLLSGGVFPASAQVSNLAVRVMAANITSGNFQSYEPPGIRIFQGLKPDIVAIQEFQVGGNSSSNTLRGLVDEAFGTNFHFYCEPNDGIPNGIVSRWPIAQAGYWDDTQVSDRGFAWARIDLPGTNDLYVVSVHLHSGGGASSRAIEATNLKALIQSNFPSGAWIIVGGDFNTDTFTEACIGTFASYLSTNPIPTDLVTGGNPDTNQNRDKPYDHLLASFSMTNHLAPVVIGAQTFTRGLVFDSTVYHNNYGLISVTPVLANDSRVSGMQHMAVVKNFLLPIFITNGAPVAPGILTQPQSQTNMVGAPLQLTVTATGTTPLAHQWRFFGTNLPGATATNLSFASLTTNDAGPYTVVITNAAGSITSAVATITITNAPTLAAPTINTQPSNQTVASGGTANFFVVATGTAPLAYQWRLHGTNLPGATATNYTKFGITTNDAGPYTVVITNTAGAVTSSVATLTVTQSSGNGLTNVVISQIYGGGGNTGATYQNDFVELFNPTANSVSLSGWTIQYASATGSSWQTGALNGTIQPYSYCLVQLVNGGANGLPIPTAQATNGINISATAGKLALVRNSTALSGTNPLPNAVVSDFVGYGATATAFEGTGPVATIGGNTNSLMRLNGGLTDTDHNTNDFITVSPPAPRNAASPANPPPAPPAIAPTLTESFWSNGLFQFTLNGTTGANYIVQGSTNLTAGNWLSLRTNAAPFSFMESNLNSAPQKFYRGLVAP